MKQNTTPQDRPIWPHILISSNNFDGGLDISIYRQRLHICRIKIHVKNQPTNQQTKKDETKTLCSIFHPYHPHQGTKKVYQLLEWGIYTCNTEGQYQDELYDLKINLLSCGKHWISFGKYRRMFYNLTPKNSTCFFSYTPTAMWKQRLNVLFSDYGIVK